LTIWGLIFIWGLIAHLQRWAIFFLCYAKGFVADLSQPISSLDTNSNACKLKNHTSGFRGVESFETIFV
jgi:hypothetical protein